MKKNVLMLFMMIFVVAAGSCFAQVMQLEIDNDSQLYETFKDYMKPFEGLPEGYAQDFPIYGEQMLYQRYVSVPVMPTQQDIAQMASGERPNIRAIDVLSVVFLYPADRTDRVYKWFSQHTMQAGYTERSKSEDEFRDNIRLMYDKQEKGILKKVKLRLEKGKLVYLVFPDEQLPDDTEYKPITTDEVHEPKTTPVLKSE